MPLRDPNYRPPPENPGPAAVIYGIGGLVLLAVAVALPYVADQSVAELRPIVALTGVFVCASGIAGWFYFRLSK